MVQLAELFRPATWSDVVGQDKVINRIQALAKRGLAGRAYWISGQSGTGKTSIARLLLKLAIDNSLGHQPSDSTCVAKGSRPRWANGAAARLATIADHLK